MAIEELPDDKLIQNNYSKNPFPAWLWLALVAITASLFWGGMSWFYEHKQWVSESNPFLQVTNRQFSLFLWQFPEYMRASVSGKSGYLIGFKYMDKVSIEPGSEEEYVQAPPDVVFLYHTWKRLISNEFSERVIPASEFRDFLAYAPEWKPDRWKEAPKGYADLVQTLKKDKNDNLPLAEIPQVVQQAFIGWKNFFLEGNLIEDVKPTYEELEKFLSLYPHYARNYWRNIVKKGKPDYLKNLFLGNFDPKATVSDSELAAFLKVAFFNYQQSEKGL